MFSNNSFMQLGRRESKYTQHEQFLDIPLVMYNENLVDN